MTIKELDRCMCFGQPIPIKLGGTGAMRLGGGEYIFSHVAAVSKRVSAKGKVYFDAELVEERGGRCHTIVHADPKDVFLADSVPKRIREIIFEEGEEKNG